MQEQISSYKTYSHSTDFLREKKKTWNFSISLKTVNIHKVELEMEYSRRKYTSQLFMAKIKALKTNSKVSSSFYNSTYVSKDLNNTEEERSRLPGNH